MRTNLERLLRLEDDGDRPRPVSTVLRARRASPDEIELTMAALAGALSIEAGIATADRKMLAILRIGKEWKVATPGHSRNTPIHPMHPPNLPALIGAIKATDEDLDTPATPLCHWVTEFTAQFTAGED